MILGRKIISGFSTLGKKLTNTSSGLGRKVNIGFRQISNTANEIGSGVDKVKNVLEKASAFNPALRVVADGLGVVKAGTGVVSGLSNTGRAGLSGNVGGVLDGLNQTANSGSQLVTGAVKTGLPLMLL